MGTDKIISGSEYSAIIFIIKQQIPRTAKNINNINKMHLIIFVEYSFLPKNTAIQANKDAIRTPIASHLAIGKKKVDCRV